METGILTADRADVMVVVWDGKPAAGFGGTGDVVDYARKFEKPLIIIDPATGTFAKKDWNVYERDPYPPIGKTIRARLWQNIS